MDETESASRWTSMFETPRRVRGSSRPKGYLVTILSDAEEGQ
jgi:hypothetical protein